MEKIYVSDFEKGNSLFDTYEGIHCFLTRIMGFDNCPNSEINCSIEYLNGKTVKLSFYNIYDIIQKIIYDMYDNDNSLTEGINECLECFYCCDCDSCNDFLCE